MVHESLNPVESLELDKKEPSKPTVNPDFEKEKTAITKEIEKQKNFMFGLLCESRKQDLSNDPKVLLKQYETRKKMLNTNTLEDWMVKDDKEAKEIIDAFF